MWILLIAFPAVTFSVVLESRDECQELGQISAAYWAQTGQTATAICMTTIET